MTLDFSVGQTREGRKNERKRKIGKNQQGGSLEKSESKQAGLAVSRVVLFVNPAVDLLRSLALPKILDRFPRLDLPTAGTLVHLILIELFIAN